MSDELDRKDPGDAEDDVVERTAKRYNSMFEFAKSLPDDLTASIELVHFYAVHIDENGQMEPEQDKLNVQFLGAVAALEGRLVRIERALRSHGILS